MTRFGRFAVLLTAASMATACASMPGPALADAVPVITGQHPQQSLEAGGYPYQLFVPRSYDSKAKWPLMFFLHGSGERGSDIAKVKVHGPPKHADMDPDFPFILVSPLLPAEEDWDVAKLEAILDHILETMPIDENRIYLTGLSRGGRATWRWGAERPDLFAALVPVAGQGDPATACELVGVPIWALHGDRDDVVIPEGSFAMARAIRACGGNRSRLTIYPDLGHNAWDPAYADPELYLWMLSQRRTDADD